MSLRIVLVVTLIFFGTSQALECFGHTCTAGQWGTYTDFRRFRGCGQTTKLRIQQNYDLWKSIITYCLVEITQNTGICYTHHGSGQHEAHQQCIGAHHPGSHCYCLDQICVNAMSHSTTTDAHTSITNSTTQANMTEETTQTSMMDSTVITMSTGTSDLDLDCFGQACGVSQYCLVEITQNTGVCYTHHGNGQHETHQQCIGAHHPGSHCFCMDQTCINIMSDGITTAAHTSATQAPVTEGHTTDSTKSSLTARI